MIERYIDYILILKGIQMLITERQLKELIKKILLEDVTDIAKGLGKDMLTGQVAAEVSSGEFVEEVETLEKIAEALSKYLGIPDVVWAEKEVELLMNVPQLQTLIKYLGSKVDVFNNLLNAPLLSTVIGGVATIIPVVIGFAALPVAIGTTLDNLASVEGMLRNHYRTMAKSQLNDKGKMQYEDLAEKFEPRSFIRKNSGAMGREDVIKILAVDMIAETGAGVIAQKLHGEGIIDADFLGRVLKKRNEMIDHHVDLEVIQSESDTQIKNKAVMLGLACNILKATGVSLGPIGADDILKILKSGADVASTIS